MSAGNDPKTIPIANTVYPIRRITVADAVAIEARYPDVRMATLLFGGAETSLANTCNLIADLVIWPPEPDARDKLIADLMAMPIPAVLQIRAVLCSQILGLPDGIPDLIRRDYYARNPDDAGGTDAEYTAKPETEEK